MIASQREFFRPERIVKFTFITPKHHDIVNALLPQQQPVAERARVCLYISVKRPDHNLLLIFYGLYNIPSISLKTDRLEHGMSYFLVCAVKDDRKSVMSWHAQCNIRHWWVVKRFFTIFWLLSFPSIHNESRCCFWWLLFYYYKRDLWGNYVTLIKIYGNLFILCLLFRIVKIMSF